MIEKTLGAKINPISLESPITPSANRTNLSGPSFGETMEKLGRTGATEFSSGPSGVGAPAGLKFSNHAVDRMMSRGIKFSPTEMDRLNDAVQRAHAKGSKDSLILMNDTALIVSVKNKTVVTVMDKAALKENVFTNIDSTIVM